MKALVMTFLIASTIAPAALAAEPDPLPATPFTQTPIGPMIDVSDEWQHYQPADAFCIDPDVPIQFPEDDAATSTGADPACALSGFPPSATGLYKVMIETPILCAGCRRLFIDYSQIPTTNDAAAFLFYARGHIYFRLASMNPTYTVDPIAHSPNIKNFTNDKLFVPDDSPQYPFVNGFDLHAMAYTGDVGHFAHVTEQGPWYVGPWYVNRGGQRINGAYLDVDVVSAQTLGNPNLDAIYYQSGFNSGEPTCPDNLLFNGDFADGNYFYGGCADHFGSNSQGVNPYP